MRALVVSAVVMTLAACSAEGDRPGIVISPDMAYSIPYDPYDPHPHTTNGGTLMTPPVGSIPQGYEPFAFGAGREEANRAGLVLRNPVDASDRAEIKRGKKVYDTFCAVCHGAEGRGDGPIIGRFPNPPSLLAERAMTLPDGALYHIITRGQGIMAAYAVQMEPQDRWRAIHYIRQLQGVPAPAAAADPAVPTDPAAPAQAPVDVPAEEQPAADDAAADEPATEDPAEQPAAEQPTAEQPAAEQPTAEQPTADEPAAEEPASDAPAPRAPAQGGVQ